MIDAIEFTSSTKIMEKTQNQNSRVITITILKGKKERNKFKSGQTQCSAQTWLSLEAIFGVSYFNCWIEKVVTERMSMRKDVQLICKVTMIWNKYKIIRLLTAGEIPHVKQLSYKEILEVSDEKYTWICNWVRQALLHVGLCWSPGYTKQILGYQKCIYQPQWFIECFNNTSVHQLIHSQSGRSLRNLQAL